MRLSKTLNLNKRKQKRKMVNELLFDPTKHEYSVNGAILPNATQIIDFVLYPNEFKWVDDETLERAREFGSNVHKSLELDFPDPLNDEELHCYNEAVRILTENNIEIITKETRGYSKLGYAGTLDLYGKINGKRAIFDYKTGSTINHDKVAWQQSLYKNILEERGEVVEEIYAVHIPKNRKGKLIKLPPKHRIEIEWLIGEYERKKKCKEEVEKNDLMI